MLSTIWKFILSLLCVVNFRNCDIFTPFLHIYRSQHKAVYRILEMNHNQCFNHCKARAKWNGFLSHISKWLCKWLFTSQSNRIWWRRSVGLHPCISCFIFTTLLRIIFALKSYLGITHNKHNLTLCSTAFDLRKTHTYCVPHRTNLLVEQNGKVVSYYSVSHMFLCYKVCMNFKFLESFSRRYRHDEICNCVCHLDKCDLWYRKACWKTTNIRWPPGSFGFLRSHVLSGY